MELNITPDPASELARKAAEQVRGIVTARRGEQGDSLATWNAVSGDAVREMIQGVINGLHAGAAPEVICHSAALAASTYLGAFALVAEELLTGAASQAWVDRTPGRVEPSPEEAQEVLRWSNDVLTKIFTMLAADGRTLV